MKLKKTSMTRLTITLFALFSITIMACSSGSGGSGSSSTPTVAPKLAVQPANYDFGTVTQGNVAPPLEVEIRNDGNADLNVSNLALLGIQKDYFTLSDGVSNPCGASYPIIINPGDSCSVTVGFAPEPFVQYDAALIIRSNAPEFSLGLAGAYAPVTQLNVTIKKIEACPRPEPDAKVYVSVTDQEGFSVKGLASANFSLAEDSVSVATPINVDFNSDAVSLSVSLVMDYSNSMRSAGALDKMEEAAKLFVMKMGGDTEMEIIKYSSYPVLMHAFGDPQDQASLIAAIDRDPQLPGGTALYDALEIAIDNIQSRGKDQKAIIAMTDGRDYLSDFFPEDVIDLAQLAGVPLFTVGFGDVQPDELKALADETGGTYYESEASNNLIAIYDKLADLLTNQYILTYTSAVPFNSPSTLEVKVATDGAVGSATIAIPVCP